MELLERAKERNTIVCLGTGTGKTFISVMLIKELAHEVRRGNYNDGGRRTFFLVKTGVSFVVTLFFIGSTLGEGVRHLRVGVELKL